MAPKISNDTGMLDLIPVGEENAISARMIWEANGRVWIIPTIKLKLKRLLEAGLIERRSTVVKGRPVDTVVYFRRSDMANIRERQPQF